MLHTGADPTVKEDLLTLLPIGSCTLGLDKVKTQGAKSGVRVPLFPLSTVTLVTEVLVTAAVYVEDVEADPNVAVTSVAKFPPVITTELVEDGKLDVETDDMYGPDVISSLSVVVVYVVLYEKLKTSPDCPPRITSLLNPVVALNDLVDVYPANAPEVLYP